MRFRNIITERVEIWHIVTNLENTPRKRQGAKMIFWCQARSKSAKFWWFGTKNANLATLLRARGEVLCTRTSDRALTSLTVMTPLAWTRLALAYCVTCSLTLVSTARLLLCYQYQMGASTARLWSWSARLAVNYEAVNYPEKEEGILVVQQCRSRDLDLDLDSSSSSV